MWTKKKNVTFKQGCCECVLLKATLEKNVTISNEVGMHKTYDMAIPLVGIYPEKFNVHVPKET